MMIMEIMMLLLMIIVVYLVLETLAVVLLSAEVPLVACFSLLTIFLAYIYRFSVSMSFVRNRAMQY